MIAITNYKALNDLWGISFEVIEVFVVRTVYSTRAASKSHGG